MQALWLEAHFQVKIYKTHQLRTTFGSWDVEKVHAVVARSAFASKKVQHTCTVWSWDVGKVHAVCQFVARSTCRSQNVKITRGSGHFWAFRCRFAWQAHGIVHVVKVSKTWGFCSISKNDARRGTFEEDLQGCIFPGRRTNGGHSDLGEICGL